MKPFLGSYNHSPCRSINQLLEFNYWEVSLFALLYFGNYRFLEKTLIVLVLLMSFSFVITAVITGPDPSRSFKRPTYSKVPRKKHSNDYWINRHDCSSLQPFSSMQHLVKEKWKNSKALPLARRDTVVSIVLGGLCIYGYTNFRLPEYLHRTLIMLQI